jgi:hypothetical protein
MVQKSTTGKAAMNLYFAPLACSMSARIALYEAGAEAVFHQVDTKTKRAADGSDLLALNGMGRCRSCERMQATS